MVTIEDRSNQRAMRAGALRDEMVKTESIGSRAIERSGASNLNEAIDKNPGVAVQVECSICNARNVLLNNMPGRYTTLLIDGIPIFSSVSSAYGLDSTGVYRKRSTS
ncbi:TonB-dependent receptor plug domain-containing protein [Pectobacterium actinidiae]|uniref:TonB-dependent receptor plug domain-containing protein n=1 Tax=Pectobacterium actinidiae TaxID=1507808 RepID=UPI0038264FF8